MTVIRPNSISGVTSITALANEINVFKHDGILAGLQLNGVNHHTSSGVSTFHTLNVLGNVSVGGTLTYQDVTNVDSVGIITARSTIDAQGAINLADSIIHTGDTNTKIRFPAADQFSVETAGDTRLHILSNGNIGINDSTLNALNECDNSTTITPVFSIKGSNENDQSGVLRLTRKDNANSGSAIYNSGDDGGLILRNLDSNGITFYNGIARALRIKPDGLIGIGTAVPTHNFDIVSSSNTYIKLMKTGSTPVYIGAAGADGIIEQTGNFKVKVGGNERLYLDSTGYLQLKTTSANVNVDDLRTEMFQIGHTALGTNSSGYAHLYNNAYQVNDNSYHYISQNSLGASRHQLAFGEHTFDTAPSGTRGNAVTWTTKLKVNHDGITFGAGNNPNTFAEFYMTGQGGDSTDDAGDWANNGILQLNNSSGSSAGSEILILGTHSGGKGQIASGIGFKRNNASDWGTSLTFRTHSAATSNIDELNEVMRIHGTGQVTINEPNYGHTPSSTHRVRVSGGAVAGGGIELIQMPDGSNKRGAYHTGVKHYAWNELGKGYHNSQTLHSRYHGEKVWLKNFANGVTNQMARIHFTSYSTWTNGLIYIHTTYSNGNASGLLTYLFTHNANAGSSYGKDVQEIYSIGSTNSHMSMSNSWSFRSWGNNGGHNGENTHALEIRRDGSTAGNDFKIHLVIFGDNGTQHLESAYLTEGTY